MPDNVKALIVERNGVDLDDAEELDLGPYIESFLTETGTDHHSGWDEIISGQEVEITSRKQMVIFDELKLDGELRIEGKLVVEV